MSRFLLSWMAVICVLALVAPTSQRRIKAGFCDIRFKYGDCDIRFTYGKPKPPPQLIGWNRRRRRRSVNNLKTGDNPADDSCFTVMAEAGLNTTSFVKAVAHGVHSITVEDLRYYFDSSVPYDNDIPTVNANLSGQHVLFSSPFGLAEAEFQTPSMRMMDRILSNDDGNDNFLIRGLTQIEKIAHGMHMLELWQKTSIVYNKIKANPPKIKICSCATNEVGNGILEELKYTSKYLRNFAIVKEEEPANNQLEQENLSSNEFVGDAVKVENTTTDDMSEMPGLEDIKSWRIWKKMLNKSMMDDDEIYNLAIYLYCKIAAFSKY